MAAAIVKNISAHPDERHLVMVTRRQFGYWLRDHIAKCDPNLRVELGFSEGFWSRGQRGKHLCCSAF